MSIQPEFEFQQLNHFLAVAEQRNFSRAAEKVGLSQSALSRSIQRLEQQVGQPLFERQPRDVVLTELGELLLGRAQQIMALVEDTFAELSESNKTGRIRLATIPTIAPYFLPCLLREFADQHPHVSVVVQEDTTDEILRLCNHGEVDLALLALPLEARYLEIEPLFEEELLLVLPNGHRLAKKTVHQAGRCTRVAVRDVGGSALPNRQYFQFLSAGIGRTGCRGTHQSVGNRPGVGDTRAWNLDGSQNGRKYRPQRPPRVSFLQWRKTDANYCHGQ